jgi:hypothetical protein
VRDVVRDLSAVKTSILDEDFVGVHPCDEDTGEIDSGSFGFKSVRVQPRTPR